MDFNNNMTPLTEDYMRSVSESQLKDRAYTPYEIDKHERDSIEDIKKSIKGEKYNNVEIVQESLEFLERLANKINIAIQNQKKENKTSWELESDLINIKKIFDDLNKVMQSLEQQDSEKKSKKSKLNFKKI